MDGIVSLLTSSDVGEKISPRCPLTPAEYLVPGAGYLLCPASSHIL